MKQEDKDRIEKEASRFAHKWIVGQYNPAAMDGYIAGATSENERMAELLKQERNNAIDLLEIAQQYINVFLIRGEDPLVGDQIKDHSYKIIKTLESLKLKSE